VKENSIEEDIRNAEHFIKSIKTNKEYKEENGWHGYYNKKIVEFARILQHILSDYKRVLEMNESWKSYSEELEEKNTEISNKKCELEFEVEKLQKENEELKSKNKTLEELLQGNLYELYKYYKELAGTYQGNCILVQEVTDKIEFLDNQQKQWLEDRELKASDSEIIFARDFLQELLEGRK
jgi:Ni,Fe-hydrogenase I large subunit